MNKNEFKNEYVEYKERLFEIDKALNKNVKDFLRFKKNDDFVYIESEIYRELVEKAQLNNKQNIISSINRPWKNRGIKREA